MHDVLIVTVPLVAILTGILLNRSDMHSLRSELKADIKDLRAEMKAGISELRSEMNARFDRVDAELRYFHGGDWEARRAG